MQSFNAPSRILWLNGPKRIQAVNSNLDVKCLNQIKLLSDSKGLFEWLDIASYSG